jgi:hypothetical protein
MDCPIVPSSSSSLISSNEFVSSSVPPPSSGEASTSNDHPSVSGTESGVRNAATESPLSPPLPTIQRTTCVRHPSSDYSIPRDHHLELPLMERPLLPIERATAHPYVGRLMPEGATLGWLARRYPRAYRQLPPRPPDELPMPRSEGTGDFFIDEVPGTSADPTMVEHPPLEYTEPMREAPLVNFKLPKSMEWLLDTDMSVTKDHVKYGRFLTAPAHHERAPDPDLTPPREAFKNFGKSRRRTLGPDPWLRPKYDQREPFPEEHRATIKDHPAWVPKGPLRRRRGPRSKGERARDADTKSQGTLRDETLAEFPSLSAARERPKPPP